MGIAIFFYKYARKLNNNLYNDFANELLDEIYEDVNDMIPIDFKLGLSGIGWGIDYLHYNNFVYGDIDEILLPIDDKIKKALFQQEVDSSDYIQYILSRFNNTKQSSTREEFKSMLYFLQKKNCIPDLIDIIDTPILYDRDIILKQIVEVNSSYEQSDNLIKLGLHNGLSGYLFKKLLLE